MTAPRTATTVPVVCGESSIAASAEQEFKAVVRDFSGNVLVSKALVVAWLHQKLAEAALMILIRIKRSDLPAVFQEDFRKLYLFQHPFLSAEMMRRKHDVTCHCVILPDRTQYPPIGRPV